MSDDHRRLDAASDAAVPVSRHARVASPLDRRRDPDGGFAARGDRWRNGRGGRLIRAVVRLVGAAPARPHHQRRGRGVRRRIPGPVRRPGLREPERPDGRCARAAALRRGARFQGPAGRAVAMGSSADRPALLPALCGVCGTRRPVLHAGRPYGADAPVRDREAHPLHRSGRARLSGPRHRRRPHRLSVDRGDDRRHPQAPQRLHRHVRVHHASHPARAGELHAHRHRAQARSCSAPTTR